jgi:hypothetical protein
MTPEEIAAAAAAETARAEAAAEAERIRVAEVAAVEAAAEAERLAGAGGGELAVLKAELAKEKAKRAAAEATAQKFKGIDPEKAAQDAKDVAASKAAAAAAELAKAEVEGNWERMREIMNTERDQREAVISAERDAALAEAATVKSDLAKSRLATAFASSKFLSTETILSGVSAERLFGDYVDADETGLVFYNSARGSSARTKLVDAKGEPLDFESAMRKVIEANVDKDVFLRAKTIPGSGSKPGDVSVKSEPVTDTHSKIMAGLKELKSKK